jgi:threonine dehydrogenase-like Zn-dependent dehydrogenase
LRGKEEETETDKTGEERRVVVAGRREERLVFFERNNAAVARVGDSSRETAAGAAPSPLFTFKENPPSLSRIENRRGEGARAFRFSLVIDTTGDPGVIEALPGLAADGGTVVLFAGLPAGARVSLDAHAIHYREVSIVGSFHYTPREADEALALLSKGAVPAAEIVSSSRPLADWRAAFDLARSGAAMKVGLVP